ncbi:hypothetical protein DFH09DRAFT_1286107 [Mycena vulgaris]|nr:hypothetical protein DFH09DRAFT_1286107 [Mycena vulgaris]
MSLYLAQPEVLFSMPREILMRHFSNLTLVHAALVEGRVAGVRIPGASDQVSLSNHLANATAAINAADDAKLVQDVDAEQSALETWIVEIQAANHVLCGGCPPLLANIRTGGISSTIATPDPSTLGGVGWWKDHLELIHHRYESAANTLLSAGRITSNSLRNFAMQIACQYRERYLVGAQLIGATAVYQTLAHVVDPHTLLPNHSPRTRMVLRALEIMLHIIRIEVIEVFATHACAVEHWLFLVGEWGRAMAGSGCVCEVVGTDVPFVLEGKRRGDPPCVHDNNFRSSRELRHLDLAISMYSTYPEIFPELLDLSGGRYEHTDDVNAFWQSFWLQGLQFCPQASVHAAVNMAGEELYGSDRPVAITPPRRRLVHVLPSNRDVFGVSGDVALVLDKAQRVAVFATEAEVGCEREGGFEAIQNGVGEPAAAFAIYERSRSILYPTPRYCYLETLEEAEACLARIRGPSVVGIDLEWSAVPGRAKQTRRAKRTTLAMDLQRRDLGFPLVPRGNTRLCLAQVATGGGDVFLVHLHKIGRFPPQLRRICLDRSIVKVGAGILKVFADDGHALWDAETIDLFSCVSLGMYAKLVEPSIMDVDAAFATEPSLGQMTRFLLGARLPKAEQRSDWSTASLSESQKEYAARDAHAGLAIFCELEDRAAARPVPRDLYTFDVIDRARVHVGSTVSWRAVAPTWWPDGAGSCRGIMLDA